MPASIPLTLTTNPIATLQGMIDGHQHGLSQMIAVGTTLYFVMRDQVGSSPDNILTVWKSTDKTTWTQVAQLPTVPFQVNQVSRDCPAVLVGSVIYVADQIVTNPNVSPSNVQLCFHRFDTGSDAFLADGAFTGVNITAPSGAGSSDQLYACAAFNNGTILLTYSQAQNNPATNKMTFQIYTPGSDSWGAASVFLSNASNAVQAIHDPVSDLVFIPYITGNLSTVRVVTVTSGLVTTDNAGFTVRANAAASYPNPAVGVPVITSAGEIIIPYRFIPASGPPILRAARATVGASPVFSVETVEDLTTLPVNSLVQQWDQSSAPGWMVQEIQGTLYAFYDIDNGDLDNSSSQSFLYYRSSQTAGVWDDPLIAFTSAIPGESLMPYGVKITGFDPVILVGVIDPTTWPAIASLTNFILFGASAPPTPTAPLNTITGGLPYPVQGCLPRNEWDWCMFLESLKYRKITFPPLCAVPKEFRCVYPLPWADDFGLNAVPEQAVPFNKTGGIVTPTTAAGDSVVITERIPQGYDGLLLGVYWFYTGSGFVEGDGDIVWRVQLNQRFLENLGAVEFQMGSSLSPMPLTEGQILLSGQVLRVLVNVPNLSGNIQIGASRIAAGLIGFYFPR